MKNILSTLFMGVLSMVFAVQTQAQGISINEDPIITRMMETYMNANKATQVIEGFRIQLTATTDRVKMDGTVNAFKAKYPGVFVDWVHAKPYYKVKIGAFAARANADRYLKSIKVDYPDAYVVQDKVKSNELTN
jgi:SPOR domain